MKQPTFIFAGTSKTIRAINAADIASLYAELEPEKSNKPGTWTIYAETRRGQNYRLSGGYASQTDAAVHIAELIEKMSGATMKHEED